LKIVEDRKMWPRKVPLAPRGKNREWEIDQGEGLRKKDIGDGGIISSGINGRQRNVFFLIPGAGTF